MVRPAKRDSSLYFDYPRYPFARPPEMEGAQPRHAVVIVGGGPVGVTAALELARHGVASVVLDEKNTVNEGSRAICIARHSMEILDQLGLAQRFGEKALPWTHGTSYYRDQPVYRLAMPHSDQERFYPMYNLQQQYIEQFLIDTAHAEELVDLRWQSRLVALEQDDGAVVLEVETPEGRYRLSARYVLAADGARSAVRQLCGLRLNGDAYEGRYVIADIQLHSDYPTERRAFFDPTSNPGLTILVHKQPDDIWRIDYQIGREVDETAELQEANIRARIESILEMLGETGPWELEWWSLYSAYTLALDDYRHQRILFLGDAAHLVPIFGVRGLNSGFADAANAAWKLACVLDGRSPETLLDSYSPERRGATLDVFDNASKSAMFMTPPTPGYQLMRDAVLSLAVSHDFPRHLINPRQSQPYNYADSPLTSFANRDAEFDCGPPAGAPVVNRCLGDDSYLLDYLGKGFTGLYFSASAEVDAPVQRCFAQLRELTGDFLPILIDRNRLRARDETVPLADADALWAAYGAGEGSFYLLRPDRHICARWRSMETHEVIAACTLALGGSADEHPHE